MFKDDDLVNYTSGNGKVEIARVIQLLGGGKYLISYAEWGVAVNTVVRVSEEQITLIGDK